MVYHEFNESSLKKTEVSIAFGKPMATEGRPKYFS
jgi:hypothetical protein